MLRDKYKPHSYIWRLISSIMWIISDDRLVCEYCGELFYREDEWYIHRVTHTLEFGGDNNGILKRF